MAGVSDVAVQMANLRCGNAEYVRTGVETEANKRLAAVDGGPPAPQSMDRRPGSLQPMDVAQFRTPVELRRLQVMPKRMNGLSARLEERLEERPLQTGPGGVLAGSSPCTQARSP